MREAFEGASSSAYNLGWGQSTAEYSTDYELESNSTLIKLRLRSNQLIKDHLIAAGCQLAYTNIIGTPEKIEAVSESRVQQDQLNELFAEYFKACDITGTESLPRLIEQIVSWSYANGDILINLPLDPTRSSEIKTVIELIDASRIKTPNEYRKDSKNIRLGVKYDNAGHILGYFVKKAEKVDNYGDSEIDFDFFPMYKEYKGIKRKVSYLFKAPLNNRPKLSRQYPVLTPIISRFKLLKDYEEAILIGARVAACFSAFILSNNPVASQQSLTTTELTDDSDQPKKVTRMQPGSIVHLQKNAQDVKFASPNTPGDNVDDFRKREYKIISMYHRIPYEILFLDLSEANYSNWRGGMIETKKMVGRWRRDINDLIDWFCLTIATEAVSRGLIRGSIKGIKVKKRWPPVGSIDIEKEARGNKIRLLGGYTSPQKLCDEEGEDYEEIQKEITNHALVELERQAKKLQKTKELEKQYGVIFPETLAAEAQLEAGSDRSTQKRPGESSGPDLEEDDALERRKEDGNGY